MEDLSLSGSKMHTVSWERFFPSTSPSFSCEQPLAVLILRFRDRLNSFLFLLNLRLDVVYCNCSVSSRFLAMLLSSQLKLNKDYRKKRRFKNGMIVWWLEGSRTERDCKYSHACSKIYRGRLEPNLCPLHKVLTHFVSKQHFVNTDQLVDKALATFEGLFSPQCGIPLTLSLFVTPGSLQSTFLHVKYAHKSV